MFKSMFECTHNCAARGSLGSFGIKVGSPCLDSAVEQDAEFVPKADLGCFERSYWD